MQLRESLVGVTRRRDQFTLDMTELPQGAGSGIIWDDEGHVITNLHVSENSSLPCASSACCQPAVSLLSACCGAVQPCSAWLMLRGPRLKSEGFCVVPRRSSRMRQTYWCGPTPLLMLTDCLGMQTAVDLGMLCAQWSGASVW